MCVMSPFVFRFGEYDCAAGLYCCAVGVWGCLPVIHGVIWSSNNLLVGLIGLLGLVSDGVKVIGLLIQMKFAD